MYPAIAIEYSTLEARYINMNIYPLTLFLDKDLFDLFGIKEELCGPLWDGHGDTDKHAVNTRLTTRREKMAAISQTTYSKAFSRSKMHKLRLDFTDVCSQGFN